MCFNWQILIGIQKVSHNYDAGFKIDIISINDSKSEAHCKEIFQTIFVGI